MGDKIIAQSENLGLSEKKFLTENLTRIAFHKNLLSANIL